MGASSPAMVLDDECVVERDLDNFVMGERIVWIDIEGVPLHAWSRPTFSKIGSRWGEVIELEDNQGMELFLLVIVSVFRRNLRTIIFEKFKIIVRGKIFVIRAKELFVWSPTFNDNKEVDDYSEDDSVNGAEEINGDISKQMNLDDETDIEGVSDTVFDDKADSLGHEHTQNLEFQHVDAQEGQGMENSLSKRRSEGLSSRVLEDAQPLNEHASPSIDSKKKAGGSILEKPKLDCISDMDVKVLWGNYKFEYTISEAVGNSGGILCVWDPSVFRKEHHVVSDNFVALYGSWVSNQAKLLVVSIYAPQCMEDRLGSVYNAQGANEFNSFISNSGLVEIQLEGYSFTWSLQSAKKMSKLDRFFVSDGLLSLFPHLSGICLDRHLSDHRPILLREVVTDYGVLPFSGFTTLGVMVDGEWVDDPCRVKEEFRLHFANRFRALTANRCKLNYTFPNRLSSNQLDMLESLVSRDEVVMLCGAVERIKSPGQRGHL
ncbi:RNA-directed DNA polymerase, eukaryota [Tanacetum coccineum]